MASEYGWMPTDEGVMEFESNEVARHALECIRACKGVRNPAAVGEVIEAARELLALSAGLESLFEGNVRDEFQEQWRHVVKSLAALDKDPTE